MHREPPRPEFNNRDFYSHGGDTVVGKLKRRTRFERTVMTTMGLTPAAAAGAPPSRLGALIQDGRVVSINPLFAPSVPSILPMGRVPLGMAFADAAFESARPE